MYKYLLVILSFIFISSANVEEKTIVGSYYLAAYIKKDLEGIIYLKKDFPEFSDTIYCREDDVDRIVEFTQKGQIMPSEFPNSYFCGFERIELKKGYWQKINYDTVEITWRGIEWGKKFEIKSSYKYSFQQNGDVKLEPLILT